MGAAITHCSSLLPVGAHRRRSLLSQSRVLPFSIQSRVGRARSQGFTEQGSVEDCEREVAAAKTRLEEAK